MVSSQSKIRTARRSYSQFMVDAEKNVWAMDRQGDSVKKCLAGGSRPAKFRQRVSIENILMYSEYALVQSRNRQRSEKNFVKRPDT